MKPSARLYSCQRCRIQVLICSYCDRGQIYCSDVCSQVARIDSCRQADKRYQRSFKGKLNHALRQSRYRARKREKVTDHGSRHSPQHALLASVKNKTNQTVANQTSTVLRCHFCMIEVSAWLRQAFSSHCSPRLLANRADLRPP